MAKNSEFCLNWNKHHNILLENFGALLNSGHLSDCTLAAEGNYLKAHKIVLSSCSSYFEKLLSEHYDKHPIFILSNITFNELKAVVDYMYKGKAVIHESRVTSFLKAVEFLQIKGLTYTEVKEKDANKIQINNKKRKLISSDEIKNNKSASQKQIKTELPEYIDAQSIQSSSNRQVASQRRLSSICSSTKQNINIDTSNIITNALHNEKDINLFNPVNSNIKLISINHPGDQIIPVQTEFEDNDKNGIADERIDDNIGNDPLDSLNNDLNATNNHVNKISLVEFLNQSADENEDNQREFIEVIDLKGEILETKNKQAINNYENLPENLDETPTQIIVLNSDNIVIDVNNELQGNENIICMDSDAISVMSERSEQFRDNSSINRDTQTDNEITYQSSKTISKSKNKSKIQENKLLKTQFANYLCGRCNRAYMHKSSLQNHLLHECGDPKRFQCSFCFRRFNYKCNMLKHLKRRHENQESQ